jgi:hypothetical protein
MVYGPVPHSTVRFRCLLDATILAAMIVGCGGIPALAKPSPTIDREYAPVAAVQAKTEVVPPPASPTVAPPPVAPGTTVSHPNALALGGLLGLTVVVGSLAFWLVVRVNNDNDTAIDKNKGVVGNITVYGSGHVIHFGSSPNRSSGHSQGQRVRKRQRQVAQQKRGKKPRRS